MAGPKSLTRPIAYRVGSLNGARGTGYPHTCRPDRLGHGRNPQRWWLKGRTTRSALPPEIQDYAAVRCKNSTHHPGNPAVSHRECAGCIREEHPQPPAMDASRGKGTQRPESVGWAVGGGCQGDWGRLLSVTGATETGGRGQGDSRWA